MTVNINCKKCTLVAFNLIFMISGITLIIIGYNITRIYDDYEIFLVSQFLWLALTLLAIGSVVIILSFFTCWSALKENYCLNLTCCVLLFLTSLLALATGGCSYILKIKTKQLIAGPMANSMLEYKPNQPNVYTALWDYLQKTFSCCGLESNKDWEDLFENQIPISCCFLPSAVIANFSCTVSIEDVNRYPWGCLDYFSNYIEAQCFNMGTSGIAIGVILLTGVLFSYYFGRSFKKIK